MSKKKSGREEGETRKTRKQRRRGRKGAGNNLQPLYVVAANSDVFTLMTRRGPVKAAIQALGPTASSVRIGSQTIMVSSFMGARPPRDRTSK